jgi:hypothetical protein
VSKKEALCDKALGFQLFEGGRKITLSLLRYVGPEYPRLGFPKNVAFKYSSIIIWEWIKNANSQVPLQSY